MDRNFLRTLSKETIIELFINATTNRSFEPIGTTKLEKLPVVLIYEIARYHPRILPLIFSINGFLGNKVSRDQCYI